MFSNSQRRVTEVVVGKKFKQEKNDWWKKQEKQIEKQKKVK